MKPTFPLSAKARPASRISLSRPGFTLTELLIVIVIILVLAGILVPTIGKMRNMATASGCASNMRQCAAVSNLFAGDHNSQLPRLHITNPKAAPYIGEAIPGDERVVNNPNAYFWTEMLFVYTKSPDIFSCPQLKLPATVGSGGCSSKRYPLGIGINYPSMAPNVGDINGPAEFVWTTMAKVPDPARVVWFTDSGGDAIKGPWKDRVEIPSSGSCFIRGNADLPQCVMPRHGGRINVCFADGHVALINPGEIDWGPKTSNGNFVGYSQF